MGLTQKALADLCGISEQQIFRYENAKSDPTTKFLAVIAQQLGVSMDYLVGLSDYPNGSFGEMLRAEQHRWLDMYDSEDWLSALAMILERLREKLQASSGELEPNKVHIPADKSPVSKTNKH